MAMSRGVDISDMASVDVIYTNKVRPVHTGTSPDSPYPKATSRIMGDHLRALQYITETYGKRGGFSEGNRDREFIGKYKPVVLKRKKRNTVRLYQCQKKNDYKICYTRSKKQG